jgi:hypothetical protein
MSDIQGLPKRKELFWIGGLVGASFVAGLWAAFTSIGPLIKSSMAVLMILAGLVLLSPFATSRPTNEQQRRARRRISVMGAAGVVSGVAQVVPSPVVRITLLGLAVVLLAAVATGSPKRLFGPRS